MLNWFHPSEQIAMSLGELRQARGLLTQAKVGARMGTSQAAVALFEKRDDALISKLRDFIEALDGDLEITATFRSGHRVRLKQFTRRRGVSGERTARDSERTARDGERTARDGERTARDGERTARDGEPSGEDRDDHAYGRDEDDGGGEWTVVR